MTRSSTNGILFVMSRGWISVVLVSMGVSFKVMLLHLGDPYLKAKQVFLL